MRTPEYEAALEAWKKTEQEWEVFLETLPMGEQEKAEEMKERLEDFASAHPEPLHIPGYAHSSPVLHFPRSKFPETGRSSTIHHSCHTSPLFY